MDIKRFGPGHRRPDGPPGTQGVAGQVIYHDDRAVVTELAFQRYAIITPHANQSNTSLFIVISGGGFVQVGEERSRLNHGEAVVWPPGLVHGAYTDGTEMRAIIVELIGGGPATEISGTAALVGAEDDAVPPPPAPSNPTPAQGTLVDRKITRDEYDKAEGEPLVRTVSDVTVEPLTSERFEDLGKLFMQGGDPKWCWCMYYRTRGLSWSNSTGKQNREGLKALAATEQAPGLVAYRDGEAIGWIGISPRESYERLEASKVLARVDDKPVWSIVCFVVGSKSRGKGVANALLDGAIDYARSHGVTTLEAYPVATSRGKVSAASAFHGSQSMFEKVGFQLVDVRQWNKSSPERPIMRLDLK